uniref:Uncharacterized protein n=1 Tax=Periophthalmus magnuspinnatus TaxID=409849 RepID=A0A3B3ZF23_9GOBI
MLKYFNIINYQPTFGSLPCRELSKMSGSDTESSCGWTLISNEVMWVYVVMLMLTGVNAASREHVSVLSSSDHSDILTLGDLKEDEPVTTETSEELYLGMSCSSQYTFTSSPTGNADYTRFSSEEEPDPSSGAVVRRRRVRRNTPNTTTEPDQDEGMESDPSEGEERPHQQCTAEGEEPTQETQRHKGGSILITCILLTLIIAISLGIGHLYGKKTCIISTE